MLKKVQSFRHQNRSWFSSVTLLSSTGWMSAIASSQLINQIQCSKHSPTYQNLRKKWQLLTLLEGVFWDSKNRRRLSCMKMSTQIDHNVRCSELTQSRQSRPYTDKAVITSLHWMYTGPKRTCYQQELSHTYHRLKSVHNRQANGHSQNKRQILTILHRWSRNSRRISLHQDFRLIRRSLVATPLSTRSRAASTWAGQTQK